MVLFLFLQLFFLFFLLFFFLGGGFGVVFWGDGVCLLGVFFFLFHIVNSIAFFTPTNPFVLDIFAGDTQKICPRQSC